jgi:hypothetical protein
MDDVFPDVTLKNGTPRVSATNFESKLRSQLSDLGTSSKQIDVKVADELQRTMNSPAMTRLSSMDNAATAVDNAGLRTTNRAAEAKAVDDAAKAVKMDTWNTPKDVETALKQSTPQQIRQITRTLGDDLKRQFRALADVDPKQFEAGKARIVADPNLSKLEVEQLVKEIDTIWKNGAIYKEMATSARSTRNLFLMAVVLPVTIGTIVATVLATTPATPPSASAAVRSAAAAAVDTPKTVSGEEVLQTYTDILDLTLLAAVRRHQKEVNGCWLYNKIEGTMKKVKLLTCGHFADVRDAVDTCATQNYTSGNDAVITKCPPGVFNPCLRSSTQRTTNTATPKVPNVCSAYVYKGSPTPASVAGVTTTDTCSGVPADQACSSYCKSDLFDLPPTLQLICVDMDLMTAYADMMNEIGIPPSQSLVSTQNPSSNSSGSRSKLVWIAGGVAVGVLLLAVGAYLYTRRTHAATLPQTV